ncbi:hypothetical protein N9043_01060 [bacterium]|nr:hypothetical protein [bacterium]
MSDCSSCCKCYLQADGSIVKRGERIGAAGGFIYTLTDGTMSETAPVPFTSATEVACSKFDQASSPPNTIAILEEVDADGKQTGVLVQVIENPDGTKTYLNLADGTPYVAPAGSTLHTSEDTDYNERTIILCDEGVDVVTTLIFKDGDITDVVSTTTTKLDGSVHTLSGNETAGSCSGQITYDQELSCFKDTTDNDAALKSGYIKYEYNSATKTTVSTFHDGSDDSVLDKATFSAVKCC